MSALCVLTKKPKFFYFILLFMASSVMAGRFATPPMTPTSGSSISTTPSPMFRFPPVEAAALTLAGEASDGTVSEEQGEDDEFTISLSREGQWSGEPPATSRVLWESIIGGLAPSAPVYMVGDAVTLEWGTADGAGCHTPAVEAVVAAVGPGLLILKYETQLGVTVLEVPILQALPEPTTRPSSWWTKPPCRRKSVRKKERVAAQTAPVTPLKNTAPATKSQVEETSKRERFGCSQCAFLLTLHPTPPPP